MPEYKIYYISRELLESETIEDMERYHNYTFSPGEKDINPLIRDYELKYQGGFKSLADVYEKCQNDFGEKPFRGRSMMIGDIIEAEDGLYMVDSGFGFHKTEWNEKIEDE